MPHQRGDVEPSDRMALSLEEPLRHPASGEGIIEKQFVDPAHQHQIGRCDGAWQVLGFAPVDPQNLRLSVDREFALAVDHRFAHRSPALPSTPAKKLFSSANCPIFAWSVFTASGGAVVSFRASDPNMPAAAPSG